MLGSFWACWWWVGNCTSIWESTHTSAFQHGSKLRCPGGYVHTPGGIDRVIPAPGRPSCMYSPERAADRGALRNPHVTSTRRKFPNENRAVFPLLTHLARGYVVFSPPLPMLSSPSSPAPPFSNRWDARSPDRESRHPNSIGLCPPLSLLVVVGLSLLSLSCSFLPSSR